MTVDLITVDGVGVVSLNAPPANAYDLTMLRELQEVVREVREDGRIRSVVIKSAIEKFFSAGADISTIQNSDAAGFNHFLTVAGETMAMLEETPKIIVAAIAGHALGGGLELALACDVRFGIDGKYQIGLVEANLGLNPAMGGTQRLPRLIGRSRAIHMITTAKTLDPKNAYEWGILDWLKPGDEFENSVMEYAGELAVGPSLAQGMAKMSINKGMEMGLTEAIAMERAHQNILYKSDDAEEGVAAFLEKRTPRFKGI